MDKMRETFEEIGAKKGWLLPMDSDGEYLNPMVKFAWDALVEIQATQSVAVVGEPIAWVEKRDMETLKNGVLKGRQTLGMYLSSFYTNQYSQPLTPKPTTSITAAELATLCEKAVEADDLRKDAERYRWLIRRIDMNSIVEPSQEDIDEEYELLVDSFVAAAIAQERQS